MMDSKIINLKSRFETEFLETINLWFHRDNL